ncbi:MAG: sulfotransferase [Nocardioides sp.]
MPPRELEYVFVVTYGRSGSTLLMGLLNSLPGYLIRGENWSALHHLFQFDQTMRTHSARAPKRRLRRPTHPFYGIGGYPQAKAVRQIRRLATDTVLRPEEDTRVTGFKEIRWDQPDVADYVAWMREVFPGARFVVNTRNLDDVRQSKWWAENEEKAAQLDDIERGILSLAESLGDAAYRVHYDDYVADPTVLRGLFTWLGEEFDEERVRATMAVRHSY